MNSKSTVDVINLPKIHGFIRTFSETITVFFQNQYAVIVKKKSSKLSSQVQLSCVEKVAIFKKF